MAQSTTAVVKQKKRWFTVLSPEIFGSREIADLPAFTSDILKGRIVEVSGNMLTGSPKDSNKKYLLKITELKGEKAVTIPVYYALTDSHIQRTARRYKERFIDVLTLETKDSQKVIVKMQFFHTKRLHHSARASLLKEGKQLTQNMFKELEVTKLFDPLSIDKIGNDLRKALVSIYPVEKVMISRLEA